MVRPTRWKGTGTDRRDTGSGALRAGSPPGNDPSRLSENRTGSFIWSYHTETPSEAKLRVGLKKAGLRFGQEVPVKGFTVDFLIDEWLVVEVDGESHLAKGRSEKDASRQTAIEAMGFTVMRVPAGDLRSESGVRRWVRRIEEQIREGPPYKKPDKSPNQDYLRQLEEVRKALRIGELERQKREALAYGQKPKTSGASNGTSETMEDYFGSKGEDFGALLEEYDWRKAEGLSRSKEDDDDAAKARKAEGRGGPRTHGRRGGRPRR